MFYPIGLRPENLFASREPFCVGYLLSPWLRLVPLGGLDPCPRAPNKRAYTLNASLRSMRLDRRTDRERGCVRVYAFFFAGVPRHGGIELQTSIRKSIQMLSLPDATQGYLNPLCINCQVWL